MAYSLSEIKLPEPSSDTSATYNSLASHPFINPENEHIIHALEA